MNEQIRAVVGALSSLREVKGVLCFGSWAMGLADADSDVDLYVLCRPRILAKGVRRRLLGGLSGIAELELDYWRDPQWWPQQDRFRLDGLRFDLAYHSAERIVAIVRKVREEGATSIPELRHRAHRMLGLLDGAVPLYDSGSFLAGLLGGLYPYPAKLKARLVAEGLHSLETNVRELQRMARRGIGATAFLQQLSWAAGDLRECLYAVNEKYICQTTRAEQGLAQLRIAPRDFMARYRGMLAGPFDAAGQHRAAEEFAGVLAEVKELAGRPSPR